MSGLAAGKAFYLLRPENDRICYVGAGKSKKGGLLEKMNGYKRKRFHRICIVLLTAMFVSLIVVMLLQDEVSEAAFLHTTACAMIMVMDIILAVVYSSGHYNTIFPQDR